MAHENSENTMGELCILPGRLDAIRRKRGLTQPELADLAGVAQRTICDIENGVVPGVRAITIKKLARALNVSSSYLMGEHEYMTRKPVMADPEKDKFGRKTTGNLPVTGDTSSRATDGFFRHVLGYWR